MACSGELPPAKRRRISATASHPFDCLPRPLEINILQSLPSLVSLVRAASTCRRWRDLASDPGFRRRFRTNHPPPVLGLFFSPPNDAIPAIPSFAPVRRDDADLAKVVLSGDFLLTPLYVGPRVAPPCWFVADSRSGRLLLFNWQAMHLALLNPLEKRVEGYFDFSELDLMDGGPQDQFLEPRLICFDEFPSRFWIFFLRHDQRRVQVGMFTDTMREGMLLPWLDAPERPNPNLNEQRDDWLEDGMVAGVFIYWFYKNYRHAIILDTTTEGLRCYAEEVPPAVYGEGAAYYVLGEDVAATEDPHACSPHIVYVHQNMIRRLTGGAPGSLAAPWLRDVVKDLGPDIESLFVDLHMQLPEVGNRFTIFGLRDGFVYFTTSHLVVQNVATWFCSLSLETGQVEKLLCRTYDARFQPYTMPWPRFLLGDPDDDDDNNSGIEGPSDSSKGNNERRQDGPAFSKKMEDLAPGPTSEKQLPEQPSSSQGPVQIVLKWEASRKGNCKLKLLLSEKMRAEIGVTLKILLDHHTNKWDMSMKFHGLVIDHEPDSMQHSSRRVQIDGGSGTLPDAYQCRTMRPDNVKGCYRQLAHMLLKECKKANLHQMCKN